MGLKIHAVLWSLRLKTAFLVPALVAHLLRHMFESDPPHDQLSFYVGHWPFSTANVCTCGFLVDRYEGTYIEELYDNVLAKMKHPRGRAIYLSRKKEKEKR